MIIRFKTIQTLLVMVGLISLAGCQEVTTPNPLAEETTALYAGGPNQGTLTFNTTTSNEGGQAFAASGDVHAIDFQGSIETPNPCYDVTGSHKVAGSRVTLTVTATSTGGICTQVITWFNYDGDISALNPGTYDFEIVHNSDGTKETVFTKQVTVS